MRALATVTMRAGALCAYPVEQQLCKEKVAQVVHAEGQLEAVLGDPTLPGDAGVVDEHVQRRAAGKKALRAGAHRGEVGEVQGEELHRVVAGVAPDGVDHRPRLGFRAARQHQMRATPRQLLRGGEADAGVGAGDQDGAVVQVVGHCGVVLLSLTQVPA